MSWRVESSVLDEGDNARMLQEIFENHFRDMFLGPIPILFYTPSPTPTPTPTPPPPPTPSPCPLKQSAKG